MKVNGKKTAMICASGPQSYKARSYVVCGDGEVVKSGETMKVLGFHLSSSPSAVSYTHLTLPTIYSV